MIRLLLRLVRKITLRGALLFLIVYTITYYLRRLRRYLPDSETYGKSVTEKTLTKEFVYLYQYYPPKPLITSKSSRNVPTLPSTPSSLSLATDSTSDSIYEPSFDIILVHGLSGSHVWSWIKPNTDLNKTTSFWPRDWLPSHLRDRLKMPTLRVRVLSLRYDHLLHLPAETICETLLQTLVCGGVLDTTFGFLSFVTVDFGGSLVKRMLSRGCQHSKKLAAKTTGVMFFGTPHKEDKGTNSYERMVSWAWLGRSPFEAETEKVREGLAIRKARSNNVRNGGFNFETSAGSFAQFVREQDRKFFEEESLRHLSFYGIVADEESWSLARIPDALENNHNLNNHNVDSQRINIIVPREVALQHQDICCFSDTTSMRYLSVLSFLENCLLRGLIGQDQQRSNDGLIPSAPESVTDEDPLMHEQNHLFRAFHNTSPTQNT
eukprot:TRINITY_DN4628_c0_g1_i1.p1 TRINITY_DN4628_c0_g1~~TRINITY_DN4628_c0_g1_i1.p1  ORF type:complete len:435 (+),score=82.19 TRINITY_DN4628_c0_g1_i1:49-1353(+)